GAPARQHLRGVGPVHVGRRHTRPGASPARLSRLSQGSPARTAPTPPRIVRERSSCFYSLAQQNQPAANTSLDSSQRLPSFFRDFRVTVSLEISHLERLPLRRRHFL